MEFDGLPLHVLLVHFVVVLLPLSALLTVAHAVWPAARRRIGIVMPLLAIAMVVLVPITIDAGQWLEDRVAVTPLIQEHAQLGNTLYPWTVALCAASVLQWVWYAFFAGASPRIPVSPTVRTVVAVAFAVVAVGLAVAVITDVVLIGEAGARAVWTNSFNQAPLPAHSPTPAP